MADEKPQADSPAPASAKASQIDPLKKASIFLMSLGTDDAAQVLKHLGPKEVQKLGVEMAALSNIGQKQVESVLVDFLDDVGSSTNLGVGNDEYIKNMLNSALGEDKAGTLIDRILEGGSAAGLEALKWMEPRSVYETIRYEHPQIQTIVLSYLDPDQASAVMVLFDEKVRIDLLMRVAALDSVQPSAIQELNEILERQLRSSSGSATAHLGGIKTAAEIMNFMDSALESVAMDGIREVDDDLAQEIQELMFVFDNLSEVEDRGIQALLREISSESLILALKGADDAVQEKVFSNMSKRAAELLKDDLEAKGPVKVSEVEGAQKEILAVARRMADAGEITLGGGGGEEMI
ncbi:MAG: flagellar motor switch protein FliG [Gammaproteobacteria bacterium]|nr:flagellar motor switch protein FliG [Gammaproteobacteria bacterium]